MRIEYHRTLIADRLRTKAFHEALRRVIVPGETTVADIGAGTGILGFLAARLGARRVILYECEEVAQVARKLIAANRLKRIEIMPCHSTEIAAPERVDVVVSETLGNHALEENIVATLADARTRHLRPGGVIIPSRITQSVAPVTADRIHRELTAWRTVRDDFGLDFARAETMSLNNIYVRRLAPAELMPARVWDTVDLYRDGKSTRSGKASWTVAERVTVTGFATWWQAALVEDVVISTAPDSPETHWEQLYLPLLEPVTVMPGDSLHVAIRSRSSYDRGTDVAWTMSVLDRAGKPRARQALDLDKGFLP